ncbi:hypothetical protein PSHT_00397 [Puccinia striiformis]|uniref:Uncharacterized protein n=1 Tax=Puccinia striiformis TaxID=27350 RepID=A0A2S4WN46_9BASI|nr:hypothetical protein PSHT_00397 [Puccinia striiformis]
MVQIQLRGMATSRNLCLYAVVVLTISLIMGPARGEDLPMRSHIAVKREIGENAIKVSNLAPRSPTLGGAILRRSPAPQRPAQKQPPPVRPAQKQPPPVKPVRQRRPTRQQNRTPPNEGGTGGDGTGGGGTGGGTGPACPVNEEFKQGRCRKCPRGQTRRVGQPTCRKQ